VTPLAYRKAIAQLGLSQAAAARFFSVNERSSRRWASGEHKVPRFIEILLGLMLKFDVKPADIPQIAEHKAKKEHFPLRTTGFSMDDALVE
jgi:hypothetical protein